MLTREEQRRFSDDGFVIVRGAFPRSTAEACAAYVLGRVDDPSLERDTAPGYVHIKEIFADGPFRELWNPRLASAIDSLLGPGGYRHLPGWGWWPISYPGYAPPSRGQPTEGWHIDGEPQQRLGDPEYAVICICLFTDIEPWGGGTFIEVGSHRQVVRFMAERQRQSAFVPHAAINDHMHARQRGRCVEVTGAAGDVVLMHPYAWHCRGHNHSQRVRVICNSRCILDRRLDYEHPMNVVETSIAVALGERPS